MTAFDATLVYLFVAATAAASLFCLTLALKRLFRGKLLSAASFGAGTSIFLIIAVTVGAVLANLYTYHRLTAEKLVCEITMDKRGPQHFRLRLMEPGATQRAFDIRGDEWIIEARVLKWHGWANLVGLKTLYRLDRLAGRYSDINQERSATRTVYTLSETAGVDIWQLARQHSTWFPGIDTTFGHAAYLPLAHGARYTVLANASGIIARPANAAAETAVNEWR